MNYNSVGLMSCRLTNNNLKNIYSLTCTNKNARGVVRNLLRGGGLILFLSRWLSPPPYYASVPCPNKNDNSLNLCVKKYRYFNGESEKKLKLMI